MLAFAVGLSLLTGLTMGFYPAWQSPRADLVDGLKEGGRGSSGSVKQQRFRRILVGAQVALSVTLLAGAALLIASFVRLNHQDLGFRAENRWVEFVTLPAAPYPDIAAPSHDVAPGYFKTGSSPSSPGAISTRTI